MIKGSKTDRDARSPKLWVRIAKVAFSALLVAAILYEVAPSRLLPKLLEAHWGAVLIAVALTIVLNLLKPLRWRLIVRGARADFSYGQALRSLLIAGTARLALPGKVGEYGRLLALRGVALGTGVGLTTLDLLIEVQVSLLLVIPAVWVFAGPAAALVPVGLLALVIGLTHGGHATVTWVARLVSSPWLTERARELEGATQGLRGGGHSRALVLTLALAGIRLAQLGVLLVALGEIPSALTVLLVPLVQSADAVPLTVAGVGAREWVGLQLLPATGVSSAGAVAAVALQSLISGLVPGIAGIPFLLAGLRQRSRLPSSAPAEAGAPLQPSI